MVDLKSVINTIVDSVSPLLSEEMVENLKVEQSQLLEMLHENEHIKVPIVGDFDAGKTSLVNVILEEDGLLPVSTQPETSIPCELLPIDDNEDPHIVVKRGEEVIFNDSIENYKSAKAAPGDYAILYTRSPRIKEWYDKGIILVDMPGASSGIKEHNEAILRYISKGTIYAFLVDAVNGAISKSSLDFINEIMQYGFNIGIFISRIDLSTQQNLIDTEEYILHQIEGLLKNEKIGKICPIKGEIEDFENFIDGINVGDTGYQTMLPVVKKFLQDQISLLTEMNSALTTTSDEELDNRINDIQSQIEQINHAIHDSLQSVDSPEQSTEDILNSVNAAIRNKATYLAEVFLGSSAGNRLTAVNEALLGVIRPTLLNSFKQEQEEFITSLNAKINDLTQHLLTTIQMPQGILNDLVSQNQVAIVQGIRLVAERLMQADSPIAQILGQLLNFFAEYVPDLIREILGNNSENRLKAQLEEQVRGPISRNITESLRTPIEQQVRLMQSQIIEATRKQYEQRINQLETLLADLIRQRNLGQEQVAAKSAKCIEVINNLKNLNGQLL